MELVNGVAPSSRPWHGRILLLKCLAKHFNSNVERSLMWNDPLRSAQYEAQNLPNAPHK